MQVGVETSRLVENKRVYVVDEDDITRTVLQFMLQDDNETHVLPTLARAFEKRPPDLLLLGLEIVRSGDAGTLREIGSRWPGTRVLLVTEPGEELAARNFLADGADGVLSKPFTVEAVRRKVDIHLGRAASALVQLQLMPVAAR